MEARREGFRVQLDALVRGSPYAIDRSDRRLTTKQVKALRALQQDALRQQVECGLSFAAGDRTGTVDWPTASRLLYEIETLFDPRFYDVHLLDGTDADEGVSQEHRDGLLRERQRRLAAELCSVDKELAIRCGDFLRGAPPPSGLSDIEKRLAFLEEIDRRTPVAGSSSAEPAGAAQQTGGERYLTIKEAAIHCDVSTRTIYNWRRCKDGDREMLPGEKKFGRKIVIPVSSLTPWMKRP
jgi:hypothetical protein